MYIADPLCGFSCTNQTWVDMLDALPLLTAPQHLALIPKGMPVYVFAGDEDPVGEMGSGIRRLVRAYQSAWMTDVSLKLYPGGRHEMLNETNRDEVVSDLLEWIGSVLR